MDQQKINSISFFSCLREAIALSIDSQEGLNESEKEGLISLILNESTDYEIMHFSVTGKFPEEKYNSVVESVLVDEIKGILFEGYHTLLETMTEDQIDNLIEGLVPLSEYGLSSSQIIIEHTINTGLSSYLTEDRFNWKQSFGRKAFKGASSEELQKAGERAVGRINRGVNRGVAATEKAVKSGVEGVKNSNWQKTFGKEAFKGTTAKEVEAAGNRAVGRINRGVNQGVAATEKAVKSGVEGVKNSNWQKTVGKEAFGTPQPKTKNRSDMGDVGDEIASNPPAAEKSKWQSAIDAVRSFAKSKTGKTIGATVIAAGLLYGAYKTYKRFFSKAARACSQYSGAEKTACMEKYKVTATKAQIADLRKAIGACKNSSNPQKCRSTIQAKIAKLQSKMTA